MSQNHILNKWKIKYVQISDSRSHKSKPPMPHSNISCIWCEVYTLTYQVWKTLLFLKHRGMHPHQGFLVGFLFPDFDRCFRGLVFQAARKMFSARNWNGRTDHGNVGGFV